MSLSLSKFVRFQQLDLTHNSLATVPNLLKFKETHFVKELKITSKWTNMLDKKVDFNTEGNDESVQTIRKPSKNRPKKANTKSSKEKRTSKKLKFFFFNV